jgi:hypothetical protein
LLNHSIASQNLSVQETQSLHDTLKLEHASESFGDVHGHLDIAAKERELREIQEEES